MTDIEDFQPRDPATDVPRVLVYIDREHVQMARAAGFSDDEIAFMLDAPVGDVTVSRQNPKSS